MSSQPAYRGQNSRTPANAAIALGKSAEESGLEKSVLELVVARLADQPLCPRLQMHPTASREMVAGENSTWSAPGARRGSTAPAEQAALA